MKKLVVALAVLMLGACSTPVLVQSGPKWQLKAGCELKAKSDDWYANVKPENKCGGTLEVIIVQGGK